MGSKKITSLKELYDIASTCKCLVNHKSNNTIELIRFIDEDTYDRLLIGSRLYKTINEAGVLWDSSLKTILLSFLKTLL